MTRCWHLLDTGATSTTRLTVLAVHGNPTWSYTWRHLAAAVPDDVRVIAPDQLEMGFSERSGELRRLGDRIADLVALTDVLELSGDVVVVAHDWGGPVSLGWLQHVRESRRPRRRRSGTHEHGGAPAAGVVGADPDPKRPPAVVVGAGHGRDLGVLAGHVRAVEPRTPAEVRRGYLAPYDTPNRRKAIGEFVADIPLEADHPSAAVLDAVADGLADLGDVPTLLVWGAGDRVFSDIYLHDLEARLPHADVHRHPKPGHLVSEDTDVASIVVDWLETLGADGETSPPPSAPVDLSAALQDPAIADRVAVREMGADGRTVTFGELDDVVQRTAEGLFGTGGVQVGDRVALMIPPGVDLAIALYGCWRMGAVPVLIDGGLGPAQMSAAMKVADPDHLIGIRRALAAARTLRWPGRRIAVEPTNRVARRLLGVEHDLPSLQDAPSVTLPVVDPDAEAAVVFTSGATGPSKGCGTARPVSMPRSAPWSSSTTFPPTILSSLRSLRLRCTARRWVFPRPCPTWT